MAHNAPPPDYPYPAPHTDGTAIAALVFAIASFVVLPVIPAIVALVLAGSARRSIIASGGTKTGEGLVTAARIVSWLNIGLAVLVIAGIAVALAVATTGSSVSVSPAVPAPAPVYLAP